MLTLRTAVLASLLSIPLLACSSGTNIDKSKPGSSTAGNGTGSGGQSAGSTAGKGGTAGVGTTRGTAGAGQGTGGQAAGSTAGKGGGTAGAGTGTGGRGAAGAAAKGAGTVQGTLGARMFDTVSDCWLIGMPDDPQRTRVIYVFDKPVACSEISMVGWDTVVTDATQALEIKLIGTMAGTYPVSTSAQPATGQASVNYTLTSTSATPMEDVSQGGTVKLESIMDGVSASGSFDLTFPTGSVSGTFQCAYCMNGHEP